MIYRLFLIELLRFMDSVLLVSFMEIRLQKTKSANSHKANRHILI